jgi:hypothetical protein
MGIYTSLGNPGHWASYDKHLASNARGTEPDSIYTGKCDISLVASKVNCLLITVENRIPHYSHADLTRWYSSLDVKKRLRVMNYYSSRCQLDLEILEAQELVARVR